jgi:hypothetical protein
VYKRQAFARGGGSAGAVNSGRGFLVVVEIDEQEAPVHIEELLSAIQAAESPR